MRFESQKDHLNCYNKFHLTLDTFPWPGVTTSFESLIMGKPVLTMSGNNGREITEYNTIKDYLNTRGQTKNEAHYFYIIRTPECGLLKGRIKIGKSSNLNARFKSYQDHYYNENIKI